MSDSIRMQVSIVVAIGSNGVIGFRGDMPWPRTGDQRQFKQMTMGHPMIMGRSTFESIGRPLPGRTSIVLTRDAEWSFEGVEVATSFGEALRCAGRVGDEVFIIGGEQVYEQALRDGIVDRLVVTHVDLAPEGDAWFSAIDWNDWREIDRKTYEGYSIATYERHPQDVGTSVG